MAYCPFTEYLGLEKLWKAKLILKTNCRHIQIMESGLREIRTTENGEIEKASTAPTTRCLGDYRYLTRTPITPIGEEIQNQRHTVCVFCRNNGETHEVFASHVLKDAGGRVTCPILRRYVCPVCGAHGSYAHTLRYCPVNRNNPTTADVFDTPRNSNGQMKQPKMLKYN